jgi:hypothetical protein
MIRISQKIDSAERGTGCSAERHEGHDGEDGDPELFVPEKAVVQAVQRGGVGHSRGSLRSLLTRRMPPWGRIPER